MAHAKVPIFKNMSKFQIACKPGHRASEHLFVIKSVFAYYQAKNKALIMSSFDVKKMFNMENMFDVLKELYKSEVKGKVHRLIYNLNKNLRIKVQTSVGTSQSEDTGPIVGQVNVDAAVISSVNLDNGVNDAFVESDGELKYLELDLGPILFMDDIFRMGDNVIAAQVANNLLEEMIGKKSLEFNLDKSAFMVMGNKKARKVIKSQLEKTLFIICGDRMKEVNILKYLGDFLGQSLEESVHQTVLQRIGLAKHSIYEIRAIIEDARATKLGGINIAYSLWNRQS